MNMKNILKFGGGAIAFTTLVTQCVNNTSEIATKRIETSSAPLVKKALTVRQGIERVFCERERPDYSVLNATNTFLLSVQKSNKTVLRDKSASRSLTNMMGLVSFKPERLEGFTHRLEAFESKIPNQSVDHAVFSFFQRTPYTDTYSLQKDLCSYGVLSPNVSIIQISPKNKKKAEEFFEKSLDKRELGFYRPDLDLSPLGFDTSKANAAKAQEQEALILNNIDTVKREIGHLGTVVEDPKPKDSGIQPE